jgi:hypothetical protein
MASFDAKKFTTNDWAIVGTGVLAFIGTFFPLAGVSAGFASASVSSWHSFPMWFGALLMLAAAGYVFVRAQGMGTVPTLPVGPKLAVLGVEAIAALLIVIRVLTIKTGSIAGISYGRKFGAWWEFVMVIIAVVFAVLDFRSSGEKLPEFGGGTSAPPAS